MTAIRTVTMSAPGKNALSTALMTWLAEELQRAAGEPILLTGGGDTFCAGLNLKEIASLDAAGIEQYLTTLESLVEALFTYEGPTVAFVNGHAIAGGCVLALACDLRLGLSNPLSRMGLNEIPLGLQFPPRTWRMVRARVPPQHVQRVVLEGGLHGPEEAVRLGLLDELVPDGNAALQRAERLSTSPRSAYVAAKRELHRDVMAVSQEEERRYRAQALPTWTDPALRERIAAVLRR